MANKIKGITIKIGGDTTELSKALKDVNGVISKSNSELKDLNRALKLDPKNTELLSQKQEVLRNNIKATTDRLNTLKEAQKQMGSYNFLTEEQKESYRALSVEISKGESALKKMNNELKTTSGINLDGLKSGLKKVGDITLDVSKKMMQVSAAVGTALAALVAAGVKSYAELEQNIGGVETLFKLSDQEIEEFAKNSGMTAAEIKKDSTLMNTAIDTVKKNAAKAYKTAGVSANEYMSGVTSFTASLLQSTGGSAIKAADIADMAFRDMSDNANKFGTDMASIQQAYQGFAKQQYQLLDNLKLGYGGTKGEMERLLEDAEKITGIKYDINNLSDVYNAIHAIQVNLDISGYSADQLKEKLEDMSLTEEELKKVAEDMGITYEEATKKMKNGTLSVRDAQILLGTTAKESELTISGSVASMKAAFDNFLNGSGSPTQLAEAVTNVLSNIGAAISEMAPSILEGIVTLIQTLLPQVVSLITELLPQLFDAVSSLIDQLLLMLSSNTDGIANTISTLINKAVEFFSTNLPKIIEIGIILIETLAKSVINSLPTIIDSAMKLLFSIIDTITSNLDKVVSLALDLILTLAIGLIDALPKLLEKVPTIIVNLVDALTNPEMQGKMLKASYVLIIELARGLIIALPELLKMPKTIIERLVSKIKERVTSTDWGKIGSDIIKGICDGFGRIGSYINKKVNEVKEQITTKFKKIFGIHSPSKLMADTIGFNISAGIGEGIEQGIPEALKDANAAMKRLNAGIESSINPIVNPTVTYETNYNMMAKAVKEALDDMGIILDDDKVGKFIVKKVTEEIYT